MSEEEITMRIHTLLGEDMKDKEADKIVSALYVVIHDQQRGFEFVRLCQTWITRV